MGEILSEFIVRYRDAVVADTTLQHCVLVGDRASGLADCGSTSSFHEGGLASVFKLQGFLSFTG